MKTKQEIEQLANEYAKQFDYASSSSPFLDYIEGYNQCQQDMADTIKQAIEYGYQLRCNNKPINSGIDWVKEFNSLNKHHNEKI